MTNDPVLALIEELCDLPDRYLNGRARELANALKYDILPQRDAERDAATRVAALEEAAEEVKSFYAHDASTDRAMMICQRLTDDAVKAILALRTQSDLDWLKKHDAEAVEKLARWLKHSDDCSKCILEDACTCGLDDAIREEPRA